MQNITEPFLLQKSDDLLIGVALKHMKLSFFFKVLFIYLTERDTVREGTQAGGVGEGEQASHQAESPIRGLIPGLNFLMFFLKLPR